MADADEIARAIRRLGNTEVVVGVPQERDPRPGEEIGNASLAYIHNYGSPLRNIPARNFAETGVAAARPEIERYMREAALAALEGSIAGVDRGMTRAGMAAVTSMQRTIQAGIPPPLSERTIRRSRTVARRTATPASATPLIDTGSLLRSLTYVLRRKR